MDIWAFLILSANRFPRIDSRLDGESPGHQCMETLALEERELTWSDAMGGMGTGYSSFCSKLAQHEGWVFVSVAQHAQLIRSSP